MDDQRPDSARDQLAAVRASLRAAESSTVTSTIQQYARGETSWDELVEFVQAFPWTDPHLPSAGDYNAWSAGPDTFQAGTWGEVTGTHVDGLLTDDEYAALTEIFDALPTPPR